MINSELPSFPEGNNVACAPTIAHPNNSQIDGSNVNGILNNMLSLLLIPNLLILLLRLFITPLEVILTPLGLPVVPEV